MALADFVAPWAADAYRHAPSGPNFDPLNFRFVGRSPDNRWNAPSEPTLYLASDHAVVLGEFARHYREDTSPDAQRQTISRQVYRLRVGVERALDLRDPRALVALSIRDAPNCFLDRHVGRAVGRYVRATTPAQAMLVPSMAFLDDPERWVAVLLLEKLPPDPRRFITAVEGVRTLRLDP
ncbi:MAG TPA: RES family NAD+ phosphorylase [Chloroflexota bacterium]